MYNSDITIGNDGRITASTSYNGQVAIYLKNNNQFIENKIPSLYGGADSVGGDVS